MAAAVRTGVTVPRLSSHLGSVWCGPDLPCGFPHLARPVATWYGTFVYARGRHMLKQCAVPKRTLYTKVTPGNPPVRFFLMLQYCGVLLCARPAPACPCDTVGVQELVTLMITRGSMAGRVLIPVVQMVTPSGLRAQCTSIECALAGPPTNRVHHHIL